MAPPHSSRALPTYSLPVRNATMVIPIAHAGRVADATPIATVLDNALHALLTTAGTIGIIALVLSGIMYLLAATNGNTSLQRTAQRSALYSGIGIALIMSVLVVVRFLAQMIAGV